MDTSGILYFINRLKYSDDILDDNLSGDWHISYQYLEIHANDNSKKHPVKIIINKKDNNNLINITIDNVTNKIHYYNRHRQNCNPFGIPIGTNYSYINIKSFQKDNEGLESVKQLIMKS